MAKGKWAQGITPRNFSWVIADRLSIAERPGGYGDHHRRVRRQEEIIWLREQGFTRVISLTPVPYNLHNYEELGVPWLHRPLSDSADNGTSLRSLYLTIRALLGANERVLVHRDELSDLVTGAMAGYLVWAELINESPRAVSILEQIVGGKIGPVGRRMVSRAARLTPSSDDAGVVAEPEGDEAEQVLVDAESGVSDADGE